MRIDIIHIVINLVLIFTQVLILYIELSLPAEFTIELVLFFWYL